MDDKYKNTIAGKWVAAEKTNKAHRPEIEITKDNHEKIKAVVNDDGEVTIINFDHVTTLDINNFLALCKWGMKVLGEERLSGIGDSGFVSYCFHERAIKEKDCRIKELEEKTKTWTKIAEDGTDEILRLKGAVTALRNIKDRRNEDKVGRYIDSINEQQKEIENQDIHIKHLQSQNECLAQTVRDQEKMIKDHGTWWSNKVTDLADEVLKAEKILKAARMEI